MPARLPGRLFSKFAMKEAKQAASKVGIVQDWVREYLTRSQDQSQQETHFWANLFTYEWSDFVKMIVYRTSYDGKKWNKKAAEEAFGEAYLALLVVGEKSGIDTEAGVLHAMEKWNDQEWKSRMRK